MKLDFEYIEQALLEYNAKSDLKQASIIMMRNIFKEAEAKQRDIHSLVVLKDTLPKKESDCCGRCINSLDTCIYDM